jgi:hypothetical protein
LPHGTVAAAQPCEVYKVGVTSTPWDLGRYTFAANQDPRLPLQCRSCGGLLRKDGCGAFPAQCCHNVRERWRAPTPSRKRNDGL